MTISVITPTCNRPKGIEYLKEYMARQTIQPDEWIVCNGGDKINDPQIKEIHDPRPAGAGNLANNISNGLQECSGDIILIMEDDDWYAPNHIEVQLKHLENCNATGDNTLRYYNLHRRAWRVMRNRGAALCQTAFRRKVIDHMTKAVAQAVRSNSFGIDGLFWQSVPKTVHNDHTVVGIKGIEGTPGLGIGHRPDGNWTQGANKLREWIGTDADKYES